MQYKRFNRIITLLKRENLHRILLFLIFLLLVSTFALVIFEPGISFLNAFWLSIVTLTTVGYGDITPTTLAGRLVGMLIMLFGIGILGMFTASIASIFVEKRMKEERGMKSFDFSDHIIICNWNHNTKDIISELRSDTRIGNKPIVLIAGIDLKPIDDEYLFFVKGEANEENLLRASIKKASTIIVLGDENVNTDNRDAKVILATLTIEDLNPAIYSIVELEDESNARHCRRANADEIVVRSEFSSRLISRATLDHGITKVISTFLSSREGDDILKISLPAEYVGKEFLMVFTEMKKKEDGIVLAVQRDADKQVITNPSTAMVLEKNDILIMVSKRQEG